MLQCLLLGLVSKASLHPWESSLFNQTIEITYKFTISSFSLVLNLSARHKKWMVLILNAYIEFRNQDKTLYYIWLPFFS